MTDHHDINRLADDGCPHHVDDLAREKDADHGDWDDDLVVSLTPDGWATLRKMDAGTPSIAAQDELAARAEFGGISRRRTVKPLSAHALFRALSIVVDPIKPAPYDDECSRFCNALLDELEEAGYVIAERN